MRLKPSAVAAAATVSLLNAKKNQRVASPHHNSHTHPPMQPTLLPARLLSSHHMRGLKRRSLARCFVPPR